MYISVLYFITDFIKHNTVMYMSIEQLYKYDFKFVTVYIYKYHNKMHQENIT